MCSGQGAGTQAGSEPPAGVRSFGLPAWLSISLPSTLQEGFAPPEDDEIEEHQQEDQDEY